MVTSCINNIQHFNLHCVYQLEIKVLDYIIVLQCTVQKTQNTCNFATFISLKPQNIIFLALQQR